jgi:heme exporter protein B
MCRDTNEERSLNRTSAAAPQSEQPTALPPERATPPPRRREARSGLARAVWLVVQKDAVLEWRSRARLNATIFFAVMTLLLFSFAVGPHHSLLTRNAPGFLWLAIFLASVLSLGESMRIESENDALDGLRLMPVDPLSLFLAKAIVNSVFLLALAVIMVPLALALYDAELKLGAGSLALILLLGTAAVSAPGTLYAALAVQARAKDVLLPLLLFPILVPGLLAAVKATTLIFEGDPMGQLASWRILLIVFNLTYWFLGGLLFGRVIEE